MKNRIRQEVAAWNNRFPLDRWWRKKYNISYLSPAHRESSFYCQYQEYYEDVVYKEHFDKQKDKDEEIDYKPMSGNWWKGSVSSDKQIDDWFNTPI